MFSMSNLLPLPVSRSLRSFSKLGPDKAIPAVARPLPPFEAAVEISSRVVDDEALSSLVASTSADGCLKVPACVAPQRVRPEVKPYREQRRATRIEPSR